MMESCPSTGPNWSMLELYGDQQWWAGLGEAGADNVVFLLGVSLTQRALTKIVAEI